MAQLFGPGANLLARASCIGLFLLINAAFAIAYGWYRSPYVTAVGRPPPQPVPFSHAHHVGGLGIDCRYCHQWVERSSSAGLPAAETCMHCHKELWTEAEALEPVRRAWRTATPIRWKRVHDLPDHVYFDHSIHVAKGVGCESCHGRVDRMPRTHKVHSMFMEWCLQCHREPAGYLRPREAVSELGWERGPDDPTGAELVDAYDVRVDRLTDCTTCHR